MFDIMYANAHNDFACPSCSDSDDTIHMVTVRTSFGYEDVCPLCNYTQANHAHEWKNATYA